MALVVASLAWLYPTRTIRAQVLTLRERGYVQVARLSGMSGPEIIVKELLPNLLPYLAAALVDAVSAAILASIGLEVLGLGPFDAPTLGMTIYWVNLQRGDDQRLVVVVAAADRGDRASCSSGCSCSTVGPGRGRESASRRRCERHDGSDRRDRDATA